MLINITKMQVDQFLLVKTDQFNLALKDKAVFLE